MCHLIFDVNMEFSRKAQMVANGAMTEVPSSLTYYSIVSRDSVCLDLLIEILNDLHVMSCDVGDSYLNVTCQEKTWFVAGAEHGPEKKLM